MLTFTVWEKPHYGNNSAQAEWWCIRLLGWKSSACTLHIHSGALGRAALLAGEVACCNRQQTKHKHSSVVNKLHFSPPKKFTKVAGSSSQTLLRAQGVEQRLGSCWEAGDAALHLEWGFDQSAGFFSAHLAFLLFSGCSGEPSEVFSSQGISGSPAETGQVLWKCGFALRLSSS